ncbi:hypothetical protein M2152_000904 [Microbacteriaceae bacterium SG_E_30_P1]|uniref:Uncharacterized protein n=1 Tax=Antiquaquibacter oligotrophicus TaxID=2880260 RepID=A0ABT6KNL0_9MICO|nr:hypothetical protein [Antiquaquibacter oligotrophicus]MDH6180722.1 hypothetical protein [Antiquaquibacter oligotrophicus]UDF13552.1 hypothetical protein LH407_01495 [Antiquaquibacter oligotrophicus]
MTDLPPAPDNSSAPENSETSYPAPDPAQRRPRTRQWVILIVVALVVAVGGFIGFTALFNSGGNTPAPSETSGQEEPGTEAPESDAPFVYTNDEFGFSVDFPAEPQERSDVQQIAGFDIPLTQAQWSAGSDLAAVNVATFPDEILNQDLDTMLMNSLEGGAAAAGGTLTESSDTDLDGAPAKRGTISLPDGGTAEMLVALKDNLQISLLAAGSVSLDDLITSFSFSA